MPDIGALLANTAANIITMLNIVIFSQIIFNRTIRWPQAFVYALTVGICSSIIELFIRFLPTSILPENLRIIIISLLSYTLLVIVLKMFIRLSISQCILSSGLFIILQAVGNMIAFVMLNFLGYESVFSGSIEVTILANIIINAVNILVFIIIKYFKLYSRFPTSVRNKAYVSSVIYILLTLFIIITNMGYYYYSHDTIGNTGVVITSTLLLAYLIYSLINTNTFYKLESKNQELEYQMFYNKTLDRLMSDLSRFKHNYNNMLNVSYAYIKMKKWEELTQYFSELVEESNHTVQLNSMVLLQIKNAGVLGLITSKAEYATKLGVNFRVAVTNEINEINIRISDLCEVLGILIDNAIEAAHTSQNKTLNLRIENIDRIVTFHIENSVDQKTEIKNIFQKGYSTKGDGRGMGLWIVNNIINKYENVILNTITEENTFTQDLVIH